ncbi:catenin alpha-3-like [Platysternon megacephalum]|uniref:Catenin alpha-3-like n=1 Tax=Platysternon megacephalum TaxID=55544 RepID=A0A4D9F260_9SAUR|nr:catenin alpha-3-like [Platysternon megacephalum]
MPLVLMIPLSGDCSVQLFLYPKAEPMHGDQDSPVRQEALLAAISEKDANIALLELSASKKKKTQEEVMALKREKDRLVHQLKQQVYRNRKQPLSMNISSICDADFITDIAAKYLGSSHDAHMSQMIADISCDRFR